MAGRNRGRCARSHAQNVKRDDQSSFKKPPLTNMEKKDKLNETEFPCKPEEDIAVYFTKLHKEQDMR